jgi:hypothetical protein
MGNQHRLEPLIFLFFFLNEIFFIGCVPRLLDSSSVLPHIPPKKTEHFLFSAARVRPHAPGSASGVPGLGGVAGSPPLCASTCSLTTTGDQKRTGGGGSPAFAIPPARGSIASCPPPTMGTGRERPGPEEEDCHPTSKAFRSLENQKYAEQDSFNFPSARILQVAPAMGRAKEGYRPDE